MINPSTKSAGAAIEDFLTPPDGREIEKVSLKISKKSCNFYQLSIIS
jgi:hypothetical protein